MTEFSHQLRLILKNKKRLLLVSLFSFFVVGILGSVSVIIFHHRHEARTTDPISLQDKRSEIILHELEDISSILQDVANNPLHNKQQQMALQALEKNSLITQKAMREVAKVSDIQKMSGQIVSVKDAIDAQLMNMKKVILEGTGGKQFLEASVLPFHVISVDVIEMQPYVSVEYANHISPLALGDVLAGWRVIRADYESGLAEFENDKNQLVKVNLHGE
jgi:hypothetical protein